MGDITPPEKEGRVANNGWYYTSRKGEEGCKQWVVLHLWESKASKNERKVETTINGTIYLSVSVLKGLVNQKYANNNVCFS